MAIRACVSCYHATMWRGVCDIYVDGVLVGRSIPYIALKDMETAVSYIVLGFIMGC